MSELKARHIVDVYDSYYAENPFGERSQVYLKSEVDKVIADLEEKHKTEVKELLCLIRDKENNFNRAFDSEEKELRRHKYKRCMAMARWCCDACDKWMMRKAKAIGLGKDGVIEYHKARSKLFHYMRWQTRWLKIAEQFKEGV